MTRDLKSLCTARRKSKSAGYPILRPSLQTEERGSAQRARRLHVQPRLHNRNVPQHSSEREDCLRLQRKLQLPTQQSIYGSDMATTSNRMKAPNLQMSAVSCSQVRHDHLRRPSKAVLSEGGQALVMTGPARGPREDARQADRESVSGKIGSWKILAAAAKSQQWCREFKRPWRRRSWNKKEAPLKHQQLKPRPAQVRCRRLAEKGLLHLLPSARFRLDKPMSVVRPESSLELLSSSRGPLKAFGVLSLAAIGWIHRSQWEIL